MAFSTSWTWVAWILPAVLFHELGHWVAMRAFGHDDARIAFVPLLGAYTMSHKPFQKRWQEVVMLLAGPLPGLFLGLVLSAVAASRGWTQVSSACLVMIGLNALNLLPIHPLDGGRVLHLLVTSGRPRVDFAVRILGAAVLLGAAFKAGDWVLVFFAATLLLTLQRGRRRPALESRIRAMPGFAPGMPPAQRRPLVFAALADTPRRSLTAWFEDVVALEAQTAYARPTVGNVLGSCAVLAIGVGGLTVLSVGATLFMTRRPRCPSEAQTVALRCDRAFEPTAVAWQPGAPRAGTTFRFGALVTCRGGRGADAFERMNTAQHAAPFCTSLPWEESAPPDETTRQARRTLARILPAGPHEGAERESERQFLNFVVEHEGEEGRLDPETIRLTRAFLEPNQASSAEAQSLLAARLGRSPDQSCRKLQIVQTAFDVEAGTAGGAPAARYGVAFETPEDFAPLASYLCAQGCELRVAPVAPNDPVLSSCR
jgi:Zn-dependent protease